MEPPSSALAGYWEVFSTCRVAEVGDGTMVNFRVANDRPRNQSAEQGQNKTRDSAGNVGCSWRCGTREDARPFGAQKNDSENVFIPGCLSLCSTR